MRTEDACQTDACAVGWSPAADCNVDCGLTICACDLDGNGTVDFTDLVTLLGVWGPCGTPCPADTNGDGEVGFDDLVSLLSEWGATCAWTLEGCGEK